MYLHTHNFPDILVQAVLCSIANVSFIKKKNWQMYLHTHNFPDILVQAIFSITGKILINYSAIPVYLLSRICLTPTV